MYFNLVHLLILHFCSDLHIVLTQSRLTLCNPRIVAHQAPLPMELSRQKCWSGGAISSNRDPPNDPGIEPTSPAPEANSSPLGHQGSTSLFKVPGEFFVRESSGPCWFPDFWS